MFEPLASKRTRIWDLPTRLFHWLLAALVIFSFTTGKLGSDWLPWHFRSGYAIATLLLFRLIWGFAGSRYARFASFLPSPSRIWQTMRWGSTPLPASAGHSAVGTLSVYALLVVLALQVSTGVFTNDGSFIEGPWVKFVSGALSDRLSKFHYYNHWVIAGLVALHVAAIAFYLVSRKEDLLTPMLTGDKLGIDAPAAEDGVSVWVRAALLAALAGAIVFYLVTL
ncbi:MAG TPA: cytochrome b/b6 domain-containing protein [Burkholderiaceae bacterium]|nr:cytochrome b/b6 domain-containing protein [Burkholderiaceae bacterium]